MPLYRCSYPKGRTIRHMTFWSYSQYHAERFAKGTLQSYAMANGGGLIFDIRPKEQPRIQRPQT